LPTSPYDGSALQYEILEDGRNFSVTVSEFRTDDLTLPEVTFTSVAPAVTED